MYGVLSGKVMKKHECDYIVTNQDIVIEASTIPAQYTSY